MRLLLDTHVALWAITDDSRLTTKARSRILAEGAEVFVSSATIWEIAIKHGLDRRGMPVSASAAGRFFRSSGFRELPVTWAHASRVGALPAIHRDPFDRLLVAQALEEPLILLTHDQTVAAYSDAIVLI